MGRDRIKQELLDRMNVVAEFNMLLGSGKGNVRKCWNAAAHSNGDKKPSLSFNPTHTGWKCHGCGEKGDIFTLYEKVKNMPFSESYKHLLQKYNIWNKIERPAKKGDPAQKKSAINVISSQRTREQASTAVGYWTSQMGIKHRAAEFMFRRYGLTIDTLKLYRIGYMPRKRRLSIPIPSMGTTLELDRHISFPSVVNIRYHDVMRKRCSWIKHNKDGTTDTSKGIPDDISFEDLCDQKYHGWTPVWGDRGGKVHNVPEHGACYLYPFFILQQSTMVYLVGGELKALLLNQLGIPAVTFTGGEGSYSEEILPHFIGKNVRVLFDADPEKKRENGKSITDQKAMKVAQALADSGATVEVGIWPKEIRDTLPDGGDVTDFLVRSNLDTRALDLLKWKPVERQYEEKIEKAKADKIGSTEKIPALKDMQEIKFRDLTDPGLLDQWVRVRGQLAGRSEIPYVVPKEIEFDCTVGRTQAKPQCAQCALPHCGFRRTVQFTTRQQIELVGEIPDKVSGRVKSSAGIPKNCTAADVNVISTAADQMVITPTVDVQDGDFMDEGVAFEYAHRQIYHLNNNNEPMRENAGYEFGGQIIADPKRGTFSLACTSWKKLDDDILSFHKNYDMTLKLANLMPGWENMPVHKKMEIMVGQIRDHVVSQIHGADGMIESIWLANFLPFTFKIGPHRCARICPSVMILGDTNTGKSTVATSIARYYGAGRYAAADSNMTLPGLIGGNLKGQGGKMSFSWGLLPTSHRTIVALDEFNKLSLDVIGGLTNMLSSGIAERTTASGTRRSHAWVRMMYLCNPRGHRKLTSYSNPLDAALQVAGTVQDLGRVEYLHVQYPVGDMNAAMEFHEPEHRHMYTKDLARYHLQWAWSRKPSQILFEDPRHVLIKSMEVARLFGSHTLLLPMQARFKVGRIAAGVATALFSHDKEMNVIVTNEHVEYACEFLKERYKNYIVLTATPHGATMPQDLVQLLDDTLEGHSFNRLRFFCNNTRFSTEDVKHIIGRGQAYQNFMEKVYFDLGLLNRKGRDWIEPKQPDVWIAMFEEYINERARLLATAGPEAFE